MSDRSKIMILATGGTIAGVQSDPSHHGYHAGSLTPAHLLQSVPLLPKLADVSYEQVMSIGSQNMTDADWLKLARRLDELSRSDVIDGFVVTHGTDTMEETSYFIDLTVPTTKPIVFVGSMRPATAISADGPGNLYNAVAVATHPQARGCGTLVVSNDLFFLARNVYKTNTSKVDTFKALDRGPAGTVDTGRVVFYVNGQRQPDALIPISEIEALPRVDVLYAHANMGRDLIDAAVQHGARGIVLAGVGNGNSTELALAGLRDARAAGVVVVRSTKLESGFTMRNAEVDDDQYGFVAANEFKPSKARVLLMLALLRTSDPVQIQRLFDSQ